MTVLVTRFNEAMKEVAEQKGVLFVDLPVLLHNRENLCFDGCHFNEEGARVVGRVLADFFIEAHLFAPD